MYLYLSCYLFNDFRLAKKPGLIKPYQAGVRRGGKDTHLGSFTTAEDGRSGAVRGAIAGGAGVMVTALGCYLILE